MTVSVAGRPIHHRAGIHEPGRLVLGLIDGGAEWLDWAIDAPQALYHFDDETALVAGVQDGLHASPFLLLRQRGLMVSPATLMTFSRADLKALAQGERPGNGKAATARADKVVSDHKLATQADLADGSAFLTELKVADEPVFQFMGLGDRLAMHGLFQESIRSEAPEEALQQEAAAFAVGQSQSPLEFADFYLAYLQYVATLAAKGTQPQDPADRAALVEAAVHILEPLLFHALECPRVDGPTAPWEVATAIQEWLMMGRQLGFSRLSQGVQQVIAHAGYTGQDSDEAEGIVAAYLAGAQALLASQELGPGRIGQDGASYAYHVESSSMQADIALGPDGIVTLSSFRPKEPATPSTT
ncbi:MAG TPA: hypothetical protein VJS15_06125 [Allosphingosinicella sp.]|nr:hypothetical protein [Allosphingosinicella sp.]